VPPQPSSAVEPQARVGEQLGVQTASKAVQGPSVVPTGVPPPAQLHCHPVPVLVKPVTVPGEHRAGSVDGRLAKLRPLSPPHLPLIVVDKIALQKTVAPTDALPPPRHCQPQPAGGPTVAVTAVGVPWLHRPEVGALEK